MLNNLKSFFEAVFAGDPQAIIFLTSIYFAIVGLISIVRSIRIRHWPTARGVILNSGLETWGAAMRSDEQHYEAAVRYTYNVAGINYESSRLSPTFIIVSLNLRFVLNWQMKGIRKLGEGQVVVFYNPSKPEKSFLIRPGAATFFLPTVFILISIILALL